MIYKVIAFDYLRIRNSGKFDGKEFRNLADGNSDAHFFGRLSRFGKALVNLILRLKSRLPCRS